MQDMLAQADKAAAFLKGLSNGHRLMILCHLLDGEKNVSDLIDLTGIPQTSMSQHLSKLKREGIVTYRREHRVLFYTIAQHDVVQIMGILYEKFCSPQAKKKGAK
ncbi:ArsR/SmtB family transcription factor [Micavibrio aeruginosavorus]|uniref:ArsR/SmtB family transcription factor n=1 Tax=Micavibrio aeruginosavorus TaxID=349221 RepID=UPI003F4AD0AD